MLHLHSLYHFLSSQKPHSIIFSSLCYIFNVPLCSSILPLSSQPGIFCRLSFLFTSLLFTLHIFPPSLSIFSSCCCSLGFLYPNCPNKLATDVSSNPIILLLETLYLQPSLLQFKLLEALCLRLTSSLPFVILLCLCFLGFFMGFFPTNPLSFCNCCICRLHLFSTPT